MTFYEKERIKLKFMPTETTNVRDHLSTWILGIKTFMRPEVFNLPFSEDRNEKLFDFP